MEASTRQPTELLRSRGGAAETTGLAIVRGDSRWGLQESAWQPWGGWGAALGGVRGLRMGAESVDTLATWGSQSGGLPRPRLVLSLSSEQSLSSSSKDSVNLETFATGDTEAEELSVGLQRPRSWASRAPVRSLPPPEKPLIQAAVGPGNREG